MSIEFGSAIQGMHSAVRKIEAAARRTQAAAVEEPAPVEPIDVPDIEPLEVPWLEVEIQAPGELADMVKDQVDRMTAVTAFKANAVALRAADQVAQAAVDLVI